MRRVATLALALLVGFLVLRGCGLVVPGPVGLLTGGIYGCYPGPQPGVEGLLVSDPWTGTAIKVERTETRGYPVDLPSIGSVAWVEWPAGYSGRRLLFGGEVEVLDAAGRVVVTTGRRVRLAAQLGGGSRTFAACGGGEVPESAQ